MTTTVIPSSAIPTSAIPSTDTAPAPDAPSTAITFRYLSEPDMITAGVTDMAACVDTMEEMFGLLYHGDYRMAGANNDSHGAMVTFPENSPFPDMPDSRIHIKAKAQ